MRICDMEKHEKVVNSTPEPRTTFIPVDNNVPIIVHQRCLLCSNSRPFIGGCPPGPSPWVCDECKEAIAFIKDFKASVVEQPNAETPSQGVPKIGPVLPL